MSGESSGKPGWSGFFFRRNEPPPRPEPPASFAEWSRYVRWMDGVLKRDMRRVPAEQRERLKMLRNEIHAVWSAHPLNDDLVRLVESVERSCPALAPKRPAVQREAGSES